MSYSSLNSVVIMWNGMATRFYSYNNLTKLLTLVGGLFVGKTIISGSFGILKLLKNVIKGKQLKNICYSDKFGKWGVVTGCLSDVGKGFAYEIAKEGLNLVLIDSRLLDLNDLAAEIAFHRDIQVRVILADFTHGTSAYRTIARHLEDVDIGILVNSVDVVHQLDMVSDISQEDLWEMVQVNITSTTLMTQMVLRQMLKQKHGAIINFTLMSSDVPAPYAAVYYASKAYVEDFSRALTSECRNTNIVVQTLIPSYIKKKGMNLPNLLPGSDMLAPNAEEYAHEVMSKLGVVDYTTGYYYHTFQWWMLSWLPRRLRTILLWKGTPFHFILLTFLPTTYTGCTSSETD